MRVIAVLLQVLAVVALTVGALLLVIDPRLLNLVEEDLSVVAHGIKSSDEGGAPSPKPDKPSQPDKATTGSPTVTAGGYSIAPDCALWSVEGLDLYYSPVRPTSVCVQPPGSPVQLGSQSSGIARIPPNCAIAPDSVTYCVVDGQLAADTLQAFYSRGELQTPRDPSVDTG